MPKDACYRKVKARYKVFPSAYASGSIAKCRKVGAANYGNKSKVKKKVLGGYMGAKRSSKNPKIARGCGAIMSNKRKETKRA
jgi:hypothetical protein